MISRIILALLVGATLLSAADPTGTWTGDQPGPNGNSYNITFKLKADGGKLTRSPDRCSSRLLNSRMLAPAYQQGWNRQFSE